ncbi:hypothetical protein [Anaerococcus marasmi]|uniref:hypothetical protein n=1 Tax=Anaerococcus marasmi TaxID=2057797 RepID=UPI000CF899CF|nr:hypothetical protein [Anaerococcus marasmi]
MLINPNLYEGDRKIIAEPKDMTMARYIGDLTKLIAGETYTFSCKMKQIPGEGREIDNFVHIVQGHNERYKSYGAYQVKSIEDGFLTFTFTYIAEANSILCYTALSSKTNNMGAEWSEIEIVEGENRNPIFVPSEKTLETAKRQYFIGGGVRSKRYSQSLKFPRQSSYRKEVAA